MKYSRRRIKVKTDTPKITNVPYTYYIQQIRAGKIAPVYVLFGADHPGKDEFINELKSSDKYTVETIQIPESTKQQEERITYLISRVFTPPLWSDKMLIVLKDFQNLTNEQKKELLSRLVKIPENYFAKVVIDCKFQKDLDNLFYEYKLPLMNFYQLNEQMFIYHIGQSANLLGLIIDNDAAKLLLELTGGDFQIIHQELEKIKIYLGEKTRVTQDIILNACGITKESSIDDFRRATFNRNYDLALMHLIRLQKDHVFPAVIVSSLAYSAFLLLFVKLGANPEMLNLGKKNFELLLQQSNLWKQSELEKFILTLAKIDKRIKTGYAEPYVLLESLLVASKK
ncbi:MAG: DNA polymerase III subunit delta [candidate division WOR-3 bacterium]|nr:DNA polymerase III subunit delta [candidate division WOR-3 bacterium]